VQIWIFSSGAVRIDERDERYGRRYEGLGRLKQPESSGLQRQRQIRIGHLEKSTGEK